MDDSTVVVTGATRGVGRAVAAEFASQDAHVAICARGADDVTETIADLEGVGDGEVDGVRADVRDELDVERLFEHAIRLGEANTVDVVVANAAVTHGTPGETPIAEAGYDTFRDTVRTNVFGVFSTFREAVPHLTDGATLVVPSGSVARETKPKMGAYGVSKAGAEAVARQFHADTPATAFVLDLGLVATELTGGEQGRAPEDVAGMFSWAVAEADPEEHGGGVLGLREWRKATR